jgi:hypothetical protein
MTPTLAWDADGLWLYLHVGPWQFAVADVRRSVAAVPDEDAAVAEIHDAIVRANPNRQPPQRPTTLPANKFQGHD